jgi:hypothetical protein
MNAARRRKLNMQPVDPNQPTKALRYRSLLTVWFAISMSLVMWIVFIHFSGLRSAVPNQRLDLLLVCLSLVPVSLSFLLKQIMMAKAIEGQKVESVQRAYVFAWALCEVSALVGLLDHFVTGSNYYYYAFAVGWLGMLLQFPVNKHLEAASYKKF